MLSDSLGQTCIIYCIYRCGDTPHLPPSHLNLSEAPLLYVLHLARSELMRAFLPKPKLQPGSLYESFFSVSGDYTLGLLTYELFSFLSNESLHQKHKEQLDLLYEHYLLIYP